MPLYIRAYKTINLLERDTCVHFTRLLATKQHRSDPADENMGRNAAAALASSWRRWTEVALNWCLASFWAKRHRRRRWWVAQTLLCVYSGERRTFGVFSSAAVMRMLFCVTYLLILWTLSKCSCITYSSISPISVFYISQGSAATYLRFDGNIARTLLQIYWRIREWNNFENQPTFVEVMNVCMVLFR